MKFRALLIAILWPALAFAQVGNGTGYTPPLGIPASGGPNFPPYGSVPAVTAHDEVKGTDGFVNDGVHSTSLSQLFSTGGGFTQAIVGKSIRVNACGSAGIDLITTIASVQDSNDLTLATPCTLSVPYWTGGSAKNAATTGVTVSYALNDTVTCSGGTGTTACQFKMLSLGANAAATNAGGSGGANGACTVQGTTGVTRTNWQGGAVASTGYFTATGTVSGGALQAGSLTIVHDGDYTTPPTSQAAEPVVPISGCAGLTGATVSLKMAGHAFQQAVAGRYTVNPTSGNPFSVTGGTGTGQTLTLSPDPVGGGWAYGTDDTVAINNAIATATSTPGIGGTVQLPCGQHLVLGALVIPFTGTAPPIQNALHLTGCGPIMGLGDVGQTQFTNSLPLSKWGNSATILDMAYSGASSQVAKFQTLGAGFLEADHIVWSDAGTDGFLFFLTTNTAVNIHDNLFSGDPTKFQTTVTQNAIRLGGITAASSTLGGILTTNGFQGYVSKIHDNTFDHIQEAGQFGGSANGILWANNRGTYTNGSGSATAAYIHLYGIGLGTTQDTFQNEWMESTGYLHTIIGTSSGASNQGHLFSAINCSDASVGNPTLDCLNLDTNSTFNTIIAPFEESDISQTYLVEGTAGTNHLLAGFSTSHFYKPVYFTGNVGFGSQTSPTAMIHAGNGAVNGNMICNSSATNGQECGWTMYQNSIYKGFLGLEGQQQGGASTSNLIQSTSQINMRIGNGLNVALTSGRLELGNSGIAPTHFGSAQSTAPALTSCGTGSPSIVGTDTSGTVTMGTTATGCVITFNVAYTGAPHCTVSWRATPLASQSYTVSNSAITLTQTSTSGNLVDYTCIAPSGG